MLVACNTASPAKDAPHERSAEAGAPLVEGQGAGADGGAGPGRPARAACSADADCRTWSSYCHDAPCVCRALAKDEPDPRCSGPGNVACFADPCMNKAGACQEGRCVLVMGATH
ncbi:MAG: hypothetical protein KF795_32090 [Labilithrix sp.]|nr:hypothetical protein [Labilithrix sp.]